MLIKELNKNKFYGICRKEPIYNINNDILWYQPLPILEIVKILNVKEIGNNLNEITWLRINLDNFNYEIQSFIANYFFDFELKEYDLNILNIERIRQILNISESLIFA